MDVATRYKLLEKIGAGSFAAVFRAEDQELGREVAVKQIHSQFMAETAQFERYWKEATLLASFQHPHIVTIYDVVRGKGWLILELMQANLRDRLQGRPMDVKAVQTTLTQALRALSALHSRGLVHGDIKPSNLMIDHRKRIKVGDFGLARRVSHDDGSVIQGTAKYMAPETLSQDFGDVGPQSDLYSLGFTAYELMCGSKFETLFPGLEAFGRDRQAAWMMWHAAVDRKLPDPAKALENVPPALAKVIARLVEKDPKKRYLTADDALADLGSAPGEPMTRTAETGLLKKPSGDKPKKRGLIIALFCISMVASAAMLFWNPEKAKLAGPSSKLVAGIVRSVDAETRTVELVDPATGQPEELVVDAKAAIRLRIGTLEELVLLKRLRPGDWIRSPNKRQEVDVTRPLTQEGKVSAIDVLGAGIVIDIEGSRVREKAYLSVPTSVVPSLNGDQATLRDLAVDDRVSFDHLLDPSGKKGELASRLEAFRLVRLSGKVADFDSSTSTLSVATGVRYEAPRKLRLPPNAALTFDDGTPATHSDLSIDRPVQIEHDSVIRSVVVRGDRPEKKGMLVRVGLAERTVQLQEGGAEMLVPLTENVRISINDLPATLDDLRANNDQVSITLTAGESKGESLQAIRVPRFDRAVIAIGSTRNDDNTIPAFTQAVEAARAISRAAVGRYAVPQEWSRTLVEPKRLEVIATLRQQLSSLRPNVQVIVAIVGQAFVVDGKPVIALADYQPNKGAETGLLLSDLITQLDAAAPTQKVLLLDVLHPRRGYKDAVPATAEAFLKDLAIPSSVTVLCHAPQQDVESSDRFGTAISTALSGAADGDKDLVITPDELAAYLMKHPNLSRVSRWPAVVP